MNTINYQNEYFPVPGVPAPDRELKIFGRSCNYTMMPRPLNGMAERMKDLGARMKVGNNGFDHAPPIKDSPNPNAEAYAARHDDNAFFWSGRPAKG